MAGRKTISNSFSVVTVEDGVSVQAQYAPNRNPSASQIHDTWQSGDLYMRTRSSDASTWSNWQRIVGEDGGETDYSFGISEHASTADAQTAPSDILSWLDAPVATTASKPYLWSKVQKKDGNGNSVGTATYIRLTGEQGEDGAPAPEYTKEWYAWSNAVSTANVTTEPTPNGGWQTSIGSQGNYAYLWRKSIRYVWNDSTNQYDAASAQYFRMSGTNGTSITPKGTAKGVAQYYVNDGSTAQDVDPYPLDGDIVLYGGASHTGDDYDRYEIYDWEQLLGNWEGYAADNGDKYLVQDGYVRTFSSSLNDWTGIRANDGDCYTLPDGHLYMYSSEASRWVDIGEFKGESGETYYTHIAWATNVTYSGSTVTSVTGFVIVKEANDTTHLWMGVLVDQNSGQDSDNASLYTWSYTKGVKGDKGDDARNYAIVFTEAWARVDNSGIITARLSGHAYEINGETRTPMQNATIRYGYIINDYDTYTTTTTNSSGYFTVSDWFDGDEIDDYAKNSSNIFAAIVVNGSVVCVEYVTIAINGLNGARGKVGRFFYYAGVWNATNDTETFLVNDAQAPYFSKAGSSADSSYVFDYSVNGSYTMKQMWALQSNWNQAPWQLMTSDFKYLIAEALFSDFAKFGSFIISGDWMISTNGTINGTAYNNGALYNGAAAYTWFDPQYPNNSVNITHTVNGVTWTGYNFVPNYAVDGLTGNTYQHNAYISGSINATGWGVTDLADGNHGDATNGFVISGGGTYSFISGDARYINQNYGSNNRVNITVNTDACEDGTIITVIDNNESSASLRNVFKSLSPRTGIFDVENNSTDTDGFCRMSISSNQSGDTLFRGLSAVIDTTPASGVHNVQTLSVITFAYGAVQIIKVGGRWRFLSNSTEILVSQITAPSGESFSAWNSTIGAATNYSNCQAVFYFGKQVQNEYW